jgi:hypothetical protein
MNEKLPIEGAFLGGILVRVEGKNSNLTGLDFLRRRLNTTRRKDNYELLRRLILLMRRERLNYLNKRELIYYKSNHDTFRQYPK